MNKILLNLILIVLLTACNNADKRSSINKEVQEFPNELPAMQLAFIDGQNKSARTLSGKTILILFQPECDDCQQEAQQIQHHLKEFKDNNLYFISSASRADLIKFSKDYKLNDRPNVHFAQTTVEDVLNNYGPIQAPSIFIYSEEKKLIQSHKGKVAIEELVKTL